MGERAEAIINGEECALCLIPFKHSHGYPVACNECWDIKCGYQEAMYSRIDNKEASLRKIKTSTQQKLNGIIKFVNKNLNITKDVGLWGIVLADYMNKYFPNNEVPQNPEDAAVIVQNDFSKFVKWFRANKHKYLK